LAKNDTKADIGIKNFLDFGFGFGFWNLDFVSGFFGFGFWIFGFFGFGFGFQNPKNFGFRCLHQRSKKNPQDIVFFFYDDIE
jgi:hypothetical protein